MVDARRRHQDGEQQRNEAFGPCVEQKHGRLQNLARS
jgi:hypothetical protein